MQQAMGQFWKKFILSRREWIQSVLDQEMDSGIVRGELRST